MVSDYDTIADYISLSRLVSYCIAICSCVFISGYLAVSFLTLPCVMLCCLSCVIVVCFILNCLIFPYHSLYCLVLSYGVVLQSVVVCYLILSYRFRTMGHYYTYIYTLQWHFQNTSRLQTSPSSPTRKSCRGICWSTRWRGPKHCRIFMPDREIAAGAHLQPLLQKLLHARSQLLRGYRWEAARAPVYHPPALACGQLAHLCEYSLI